jgi:hypothetical protein
LQVVALAVRVLQAVAGQVVTVVPFLESLQVAEQVLNLQLQLRPARLTR